MFFSNPFKWALSLVDYTTKKDKHPDDYYLSFQEIVEKAGFKFDQYKVPTEDGYILKMFRIRKKEIAKNPNEDAPVVFL